MPDLFDYLTWRGELSMGAVPPCEVDALALSLISYIDLGGIVPPPGQGEVSLRRAAEAYFFRLDPHDPHPLGLIIPGRILELFRRMAQTRRFGRMGLSGYVDRVSRTRRMQFSAITARAGERAVLALFRGTDDTLVGWREDFDLAYLDEIPAQRMAAEYLDGLDLTPDARLTVAGHSKGGNLAVWGAVHASERVRRQIAYVDSFDGPGFSEEMLRSEAYRALAGRIRHYVPEDSLVGLLLDHAKGYTVVSGSRRGLLQHNGLCWEISGGRFLRPTGLSRRGIHADTVVRARIAAMSRAERETLVGLIFSLLEATGATTLTELSHHTLRAALILLRGIRELDRETRETAAFLLCKLTGRRRRGLCPSGVTVEVRGRRR